MFFECSYSVQIWESLARGIMGNSFSSFWSAIMNLVEVGGNMGKKKLFCLRYAFQTVIYALWLERNKVKHGENLTPSKCLEEIG